MVLDEVATIDMALHFELLIQEPCDTCDTCFIACCLDKHLVIPRIVC